MRVTRPAREWLAVAPAMVVPFLASLFYFVLFQESVLARGVYGGTKLFTLVWPVLALWLILGERLPRPAGGAHHWRAVLPGLITGFAMVAVLLGLMGTPVGEVVARGGASMRAKAQTFGILEHYWLFGLLLSLAHSLLEEYYWRWFVYGRLCTLVRPAAAHALAGAAFAAHHVVIASQYFGLGWGLIFGTGVGLGGVIWSLLYQRQQTLLGAWMSHLVVDLGLMSVGHKILFDSYF